MEYAMVTFVTDFRMGGISGRRKVRFQVET